MSGRDMRTDKVSVYVTVRVVDPRNGTNRVCSYRILIPRNIIESKIGDPISHIARSIDRHLPFQGIEMMKCGEVI